MGRENFGDNSHYYSQEAIPEREPGPEWDTPLESRIRGLLATQKLNAREQVEQACKQSNLAIREYLRSETALKLSHADQRQSVPYKVVDGIPRSFERFLDDLPDPILLMLLQRKQLLRNGEEALSLVIKHLPQILRLLEQESGDEKDKLSDSRVFIEKLLAKVGEFKLSDIIRQIDEDVLGAYFFRVPRIEIYWMPIGLIAGILDVSVEDLSFVVLAHELAHAYTHIGFDIDGVQWNTEEFARSHTMIVEGLAQFYTESICKKYESRQPSILDAFNKLLDKQPKPYTEFRNWPQDHAAEVVRFSMISARSNNIGHYDDFLAEMDSIKERISVKTTPLEW